MVFLVAPYIMAPNYIRACVITSKNSKKKIPATEDRYYVKNTHRFLLCMFLFFMVVAETSVPS